MPELPMFWQKMDTKWSIFIFMGILVSVNWPQTFRQNLFNVFRYFPDYHFIVKVEKPDNLSIALTKGMDNVFLDEWIPQIKLLNHPRLRLFISHSGYNSLLEAARAGIPILTIPFFGDQHRNARVPERNGWGICFEKGKLLEESQEFESILEKILENPEYMAKAKRIQKLILTKPFSPEKLLQKSTRFLEENGGILPELLPESRNMDVIQLYNLDLFLLFTIFIAFLFGVFLMVLIGIGRQMKKICKRIKKDDNKKNN